jgi:hypothetical protein
VDVMMVRAVDIGRLGRGGRDDAGGELAGVYRTRLRNFVLAVVLAGSAVLGCSNFSGSSSGDWMWSRRVPIAVVLGSVVVARVLRRAVIVSPFGLEAHRTLYTWRVPWSAVESFAVAGPSGSTIGEGPLTVVLIDGSTRYARVGCGRRGECAFAEVAAAAQHHSQVRPRGYLDPNRPLQVFILGGIALMVVCAIADIGRMNYRLFRAGEVFYTADELRDLELEIAIAGAAAVFLYVTCVVAGIAAVVWSQRTRGVAPTGPWPAMLRFPGDDDPDTFSPAPAGDGDRPVATLPPPHPAPSRRPPFDIPPRVICRDAGVFNAEGTLLAAISHRKVAWTDIDTYTYWSARGVVAFSVQIQPPPVVTAAGATLSGGAQWLITSWESPLSDHLEVATPHALILHSAGTADSRLIADHPTDKGRRYTAVDEHHRTLATIERSWPGWECQMNSDLPITTQRLLCVASLWAEQQYTWLRTRD